MINNNNNNNKIAIAFLFATTLLMSNASAVAIDAADASVTSPSSVAATPTAAAPAAATTTTTTSTTTNANTNASDMSKAPVHIVTATPFLLTTTEPSTNVAHIAANSKDKTNENTAAATELLANAEQEEQVVSASNPDSAVYGAYAPDAIQHYLHQYGPAAAAAAAAAAYGPYGAPAAYPAPIGYAQVAPAAAVPAIYPSPYMVQTGYEGFLVPTTASTTTSTAATTTSTTQATTDNNNNNNNDNTSLISMLNPITLLTNLFPALMMSTLFRVFATLISVIGMIFLGNTLTSAICHFTPVCDISFRAFSYLRQRGAVERIGHFIADESNQERVRRAAEFIQNAIQKYNELQRLTSKQD